jgi:hypothetical protein
VSREKEDPDSKDLSVVCKLNETEIFKVAVKVDFKGEDSTRVVLGVDGLTLTEQGLLQAFLMDQDKLLGVLDLAVEQTSKA